MFPHDDLNDELRDAVQELVNAVESLGKLETDTAWDVHPHTTSDDTNTITTAADNLNRRLEG